MEFKNDLGKPWRYEEGDFTVVRTSMWSPPGCHPVGCGLKLYVDKEGRLDHVEGDENNPITKGRLCVRCLALKDYVYNPSRIVVPLKRDPQFRGQHDKWERISWEEAYETIRDNVVRLVEEHGAECIVGLNGTGRSGGIILNDLVQACLGSPNATTPLSGFACYQPRSVACSGVLGAYYPEIDYAGGLEGTYDNPAYTVPEVIVCWGKMPLASNGDGLWGHAVIDLMKRGAKLICVDPRITWLSTRAEIQLRVRPGTDTALAMAWLHVIINEGLYDHDFVDRWCYGFDEFAQRLNDPEKGMTPEKAAEICEVPVEDIYQAARRYATAKPATIAWGLALDQNQNGNQAGQCIVALMAITGNVDVPGGNIFPVELIAYSGGWGGELISEEQKAKRIGLDVYPLLSLGFQVAQTDELLKTMLTDKPYKMRGIWLQTNNAIACMGAEPRKVLEALLRLEFNVVVDLFMTPTAMACADVVLPACTYPEKDGLRLGDGLQRGEVINKVTQVGEAKSDAEINLLLGKRLNPEAWPWDSIEDMLSSMIATTGMTFPELRDQAPLYLPFEYKRYEKGLLRADGKPGFNTATGRIELWSTFYNQCGLDPMPYFDEPNPGPGATPELMDEYPYVLTTGPPLELLPLRASPGRPPAPHGSLALHRGPSRHGRRARVRRRRMGVGREPAGTRQANRQDHPDRRPARGVLRPRMVAARARSREPLRRLRRQHQQPGSDVLRQVRLRRQLQDLDLQAVQGSGRGVRPWPMDFLSTPSGVRAAIRARWRARCTTTCPSGRPASSFRRSAPGRSAAATGSCPTCRP